MGIIKPPFGTPLNRAHPLAQGLVGCWLFNEGSGNKVYDSSGKENHGTLTNIADPPTSTSGWSPGSHGGALAFDGENDLISLGNLTALFTDNKATFIIWLSLALNTPTEAVKGGSWYFNPSSAVPYYPYTNGSIYDGSFKTIRETVGAGIITDRTQTHQVVITREDGANGWKFYQNGGCIFTASGGDWQMSTSITISSIGYRLFGSISNFSLYNKVLSAEEIAYLYAFPYAMFEEPGYIPFALGEALGISADMVSSTPDDANLICMIMLSGAAEITSSTPSAAVNITRVLDGISELVSTTPSAAVAVTRILAGIAELASLTPDDVDLSLDVLARIFAGTAALETSTPSSVLAVIRAFSGAAPITSATPAAAINIIRNIIGTSEMESLTPSAAIAVMRVLDGVAELVSVSPVDSAILVIRAMAGLASITSDTPSAAIEVLRVISGLASLVSATPDDATLSMSGLIILAGIAAMQISTPSAAMSVTRKIAGLASMVTASPDSVLAVVRALAGIAEMSSVTPASAMSVVRNLTGAVDMQTLTPAAAASILRILAGVAEMESVTPDDANLAGLVIMAGIAAMQTLTPDDVALSTGEVEAIVDYIVSIRRRRRS